MPLFSRKERIPDPCISILLDEHCRGPHFPGSNISGYINVSSPAQRQIQDVKASFYGHVVTHSTRTEGSGNNQRTIHFKDDANLFYFEQSIAPPTTMEFDRVYSWPFQFQFPHASGGLVGPAPYTGKTASSGVYTTDSHPLPPSFNLMRSSSQHAIVEYKVEAQVQFAGEEEPFVEDSDRLDFIPAMSRPQQSPFAEFIDSPGRYSSSRLVGEEKSLGHSIRDKFSSQTPSVNLVLKATVPSHLTTSGGFPIYACIEVDSFSDHPIEIPSVNITIKSLKLRQYTFYRALRNQGSRENEEIYEESVPLNTVPELRQVERQHGDSGGRKFMYFPASFEARTPGATCPSFQTFTVNHSFQLEFKLEAEICEKKFDFKVEVPDVIVFPS